VAERSVDESPDQAATVESTRIRVTIRYFAAARAAAGVTEEQVSVPVSTKDTSGRRSRDELPTTHHSGPAVSTVGALLDGAADRHGPGLARVLARCSFLLDEVAVHGRQTPVLDGQVLDILPPFAGG
jgi:molybdopterin converting factor small subunit